MQDPALEAYFELLRQFDPTNEVAIDAAHNLFLFGAIAARKPQRVLELGIGSGFTSHAILCALRFNGRGTLTCVDNWHDTGGREPTWIAALREAGANIVAPVREESFVRGAPADSFDMLISDADHNHSHEWLDQHLRITSHDAFLFFHDTNYPPAPGLRQILALTSHLPNFHFVESTRHDERCDRGWYFVINKKDAR